MGVKDVLAFEGFNLKSILQKIKDNPERLLLGAVDPASSKVWGKVLGKDYAPMVDQMGGATKQTYNDAGAAGIDIRDGKKLHDVAHVVAGAYAGNYGAGKLGIGGGQSSGGSGGQGFSPGEMNFPGMTESVQAEQPPVVQPLEVSFDAEGRPLITSTREAKRPISGDQPELVERGARGENLIDQVGVQIAAIQALSEFFDEIEVALTAAVKKKGS